MSSGLEAREGRCFKPVFLEKEMKKEAKNGQIEDRQGLFFAGYFGIFSVIRWPWEDPQKKPFLFPRKPTAGNLMQTALRRESKGTS